MISKTKYMAGAAFAAALGATAWAQGGAGGGAVYWMTADTMSGMSAMSAAGGDASSVMAMMKGGSSSFARTLTLQLGTGRKAPAPSAEHVPPAALKAGATLPLVSPTAARAPAATGPWTGTAQKPKGRMLIYWGCGDRVRAGQPLVVDFAALASGKVPPAFAATMLKPMTPPSAASHATYGEWPNARSQARVPSSGSLVGEHVVRGNYTPEIRFTLGAGSDFLAPVALTSQSAAPSGAFPLAWRAVPGARAWFASTMGAGENGDFVMWSSSETQMAAMVYDHVSDADIARLVKSRALMPATADRCTVPAEVAKAAPQSMLSLVALGGEQNFVQPKPAGAAAAWRPEWTVKLRTKSTYAGMLGMDMAAMMGGRDSDDDAGDVEDRQPRRKESKAEKIGRGLGRLLGN